jgi:CDP-diacylglycerol---glycerol-3-phosphate 3-phosphatidyltransferase
VNLPNAITVGRIAMTPFIAWLPFTTSWSSRLAGFALFLVAAITDYWDGHLARRRNLVTDLGRLLDPLADKLLLVATLVPMYLLQRHAQWIVDPATADPVTTRYLFVTPVGLVSFPLLILIVVLGRELMMTLFRQYAARRGIVISSIGPAKWKTGFQLTWTGAAYFWFFARAFATRHGWSDEPAWHAFALFNGLVGVGAMIGAIALTLYSLWLYASMYGRAVAES